MVGEEESQQVEPSTSAVEGKKGILLQGVAQDVSVEFFQRRGCVTHQVHLVSKLHGDDGLKDLVLYPREGSAYAKVDRLKKAVNCKAAKVVTLKNEETKKRKPTRVVMYQVVGVNELHSHDVENLITLFNTRAGTCVKKLNYEVGNSGRGRKKNTKICTIYVQVEDKHGAVNIANCAVPLFDSEPYKLVDSSVVYLNTLQTSPKPYVFCHEKFPQQVAPTVESQAPSAPPPPQHDPNRYAHTHSPYTWSQ